MRRVAVVVCHYHVAPGTLPGVDDVLALPSGDVSDEQKAEYLARAAAWEKVSDKVPELIDLGIAAVVKSWVDREAGAGEAAE